jgi:hypothetical protein
MLTFMMLGRTVSALTYEPSVTLLVVKTVGASLLPERVVMLNVASPLESVRLTDTLQYRDAGSLGRR